MGGKTSNKKKDIFEEDNSSKSLKDFSSIRGDATNRVVSRKLNLGLNMNQLRSLDKLSLYSGVQKNGEEDIKKLADINSKLEGGTKNKLMSFLQNDNSESIKENKNKDKDNKEKNDINEKEKADKPKRVKNSLKKLRGIDIWFNLFFRR